jgi:hypothetical protein
VVAGHHLLPQGNGVFDDLADEPEGGQDDHW